MPNQNKKFYKMGRDSIKRSLTYVEKLVLGRASEEELKSFDNGVKIATGRGKYV